MLTSKHHNLNKLVWRYGLTSAAAVLLAFGGGASSVKAETAGASMTPQERTRKIEEIKKSLESYPKMDDSKFWESTWYGGSRFKDNDFQDALKKFTEQRLKDILELIEKGATKGDKGDAGPKGERGPAGPEGKPGKDGAKGDTGPRGERGEQGIQGEQGKAGEKGEKGDRGETGAQGPAGPQGEAGKPGEQGPQGEAGQPGEKAPEKSPEGEAGQPG
ncbi:TPA: hypothetical protein ACF4YK_001775, partial [Streptococcus pyogenes]|nr:collagen-like protein [Streptococcus pyogenes]HES3433857.1 collagen-like protein [Streptococcus pyogenes]